MLNIILKKRSAQASAAILVLLLLVSVTIALANTGGGSVAQFAALGANYITAKEGGTIILDDNTQLIIPKRALKHDTYISAKVVYNTSKIMFHFEPEGLVFRKRVYLQKSRTAMKDANGYTLYYAPDPSNLDNYTETIRPTIDSENVTWSLKHFSLYYHRRR